MKLLLKFYKLLRITIFVQINNILIIIIFSLRRLFLGFQNAALYLSKIDKNAIIPILRLYGASIDSDCDIESGLIIHNCRDFQNLKIGCKTHIGKQCFLDLRERITIHNNVVISMRTTLITHIDLSKSLLSNYYPSKSRSIIINSNCYIGANSTILMGVEIGEKSIIAAGSLVNSNVPSNSVFGGVPSKLIKRIF
ncbi:MAG TPA: acyltransferase [Bacteroidales bacterium]|nr:acyltransferase [Bacteroidales bacterium]